MIFGSPNRETKGVFFLASLWLILIDVPRSGAEEKVHFMTYYMKPVQIVSSFCSFLFTVLKELNRLFETVFLLIGTLK